MKHRTLVALVAVGALLVGGLVSGVIEASASASSQTYYACLARGKLTGVGTTAPTCPGTATQISWNSQGAPGPTGPQGPVGQASVINLPPGSACPVPPALVPGATPQAFLNIPSIPGEATDANHPNQINVLSWSLGALGPNVAQGCDTSGASSSPNASAQQLTVVMPIDKASPSLAQAAEGSTDLGPITLSVTKSSPGQSPVDYLVYTFEHVFTTKIDWSGPGDEGPEESITFVYGKLGIKYYPQNSDGTLGLAVSECYNFDLHAPC
jgi:type VI secretion system secreted protein Hcp